MRDETYKLKQKRKRAEQQKRRRKYTAKAEDIGFYVPLITGDVSNRPVAYCTYHKGFLTLNMARVHKCTLRECTHFHENIDDYIDFENDCIV